MNQRSHRKLVRSTKEILRKRPYESYGLQKRQPEPFVVEKLQSSQQLKFPVACQLVESEHSLQLLAESDQLKQFVEQTVAFELKLVAYRWTSLSLSRCLGSTGNLERLTRVDQSFVCFKVVQ